MSETLAERFEALRPGLLRLAYGQLGSLAESEDVVQEAWLRLQRVDADEIRDLKGWLTTAVSRLALDTLRSALGVFANRKRWTRLQTNGMQMDFSWDRSAAEYVKMYKRLRPKVARRNAVKPVASKR